mmetsp:Transcript_51963/g.105846  ORF Transcript_51963/g.105846 Transcript_51963/m.105846 type:complete len:304 (+) Transcript_51963:240-1151(+)
MLFSSFSLFLLLCVLLLLEPVTDLLPDDFSRFIDRRRVRGQRGVRPEVVAGAGDHQHRLLGIGLFQHAVGLPGVDLAVGEDDARRLDVRSTVHGIPVLDLVVHLLGRHAEGLLANVVVHVDIVQTLRIGAVGANVAGLVKSPLRAGLVEPHALRVGRVAHALDHGVVVGLHAGTHVLNRGQTGEAVQRGSHGFVGHEGADRGDVAVRRSAGGVVGLHGQVDHTVSCELLSVLGGVQRPRGADVESLLQTLSTLLGVQFLSDVFVSSNNRIQARLGAAHVHGLHGGCHHVVVAGHIHGALQRGG